MKHLAFIILVIISFDFYGQNHGFLPTRDAFWRCSYSNADCFLNGGYFSLYQYTIPGDTILDSVLYHQIHRSGSLWCTPYPSFNPPLGYIGGFRNDTAEKKVFFRHVDSTNEVLLFDFNMKIGDTVTGYLASYSQNFNSVITKIDTIVIDNMNRLRWYYEPEIFEQFWSGYIIEGIGTEFGLLEGLARGFENTFQLNCFSEGSHVLFPYFEEGNCDFSSINSQDKSLDFDVVIYPNPTSDIVRFESSFGLQNIELYNLQGELVKSISVESSESIDVSGLSRGAYSLIITDLKGNSVKKILIRR